MSTQTTHVPLFPSAGPTYDTVQVPASAALHWIVRGTRDFLHAPALSLIYGLLFLGLCSTVIFLVGSLPWYTLGFLTSLVVIGPFLACGVYAAGRDIEKGVAPSLSSGIELLAQRKTYLALFALMLALVMAAWVRFSALLFALKFNTLGLSVQTYFNIFASSQGWIAVVYFFGIALLLATVLFTVSAIAIPLIFDRDANFITAMQTSARVVKENFVAMLVWASAIIGLTALGVITVIGLVIVFPVLGYATWHSYRALVR